MSALFTGTGKALSGSEPIKDWKNLTLEKMDLSITPINPGSHVIPAAPDTTRLCPGFAKTLQVNFGWEPIKDSLNLTREMKNIDSILTIPIIGKAFSVIMF
jgi:hypothetical protein